MAENIFKKIAEARVRFTESRIKKTGENKFSHYFYFELSDILPTCIRICNEVGLAPIISFDKEFATMTVYNVDNPNESFVITSPMDGADLKGCHEIQNTGARETYSRRYLWFSLFEITEPDALDSSQKIDNSNSNPVPKKKQNCNDSKEAVPMDKLFNPTKVWVDVNKYLGFNPNMTAEEKKVVQEASHDFIAEFNIKAIKEITPDTANKIYEKIKKDAEKNGLNLSDFGLGPEAFEGDSL